MKLTSKISIEKSRDPSWVKWGVIAIGRSTEWFGSESEAIAYARSLDIGVSRQGSEHAALVAVAEAATNCNISWNVVTVSHLKDCLAALATVRAGSEVAK